MSVLIRGVALGESVLIRGVSSLEYFITSVFLKSVLIRGVALGESVLVRRVALGECPYKRGGTW